MMFDDKATARLANCRRIEGSEPSNQCVTDVEGVSRAWLLGNSNKKTKTCDRFGMGEPRE
jgi:hypothetical protein